MTEISHFAKEILTLLISKTWQEKDGFSKQLIINLLKKQEKTSISESNEKKIKIFML
jgi:hypothetical protein